MRAITKILVGVEFTDAGQSAVNEAALLARTFGAQLTLLHAMPDLAPRDEDARRIVEHAQGVLERMAEGLEGDGVAVRRPSLVSVGQSAADALLAAVVEHGPDLVVLGAGTRTTLDRVLLGATAERVVAESPRPVGLTRPGKDHARVKRIVCAVDASDPAREALATAAFLARTFVAELHTLCVLSTERPAAAGEESPADPLGAAFRAALERIDLHGIQHSVALRHGKPAAQIVDCATELGADVLILGSARRTGLSRLVRGNTAEKVLRQVPCSLLTVPVTVPGQVPA
jgi:universal stress protein E